MLGVVTMYPPTAQTPEFVTRAAQLSAGRSDHLRQHFLRYFGKVLLRLARRAVAREQVESARRPRTVVGAMLVAVAMQTDWPARQPPQKIIGTITSLPFFVRATILTRRSSWLSTRRASPFSSSRSIATTCIYINRIGINIARPDDGHAGSGVRRRQ